ncbi:ATP-dependent DNA helicase Rep [Phycisphaerales bacterium]|nr:ATP-dependent DNA helicase Rep [Phycisphaerales bacterium]
MLAGLTDSQREAVTHDGGPLVVLAGPGTGKTRVIIHRIAYAIRERGVKPESILAVTFTVKAARELRTRLTALVGEAEAARVGVHTFNGYGYQLLRRFADYLGLPPEVSLIDPVQSRRTLKRLIVEHGLFPHARAEGLDTLAERLTGAFDTLANMGKLPEECVAFAKAWRARLDGGGGPRERNERDAEEWRCRNFEHEARAYGLFVEERWRRGWLDYDDQVLLPIRLLRERSAAAAIVRSELSCVVVDEFQDCNPSQIEFLKLLVGPGTRSGAPDVTVVGDDDQSIYAFRGADERAFERFEKVWPGARVVALTENYRSGDDIITVANAVIANAGRRFRADKTLRRAAGGKAPVANVRAVKLGNDFDDGDSIAAMLLMERAANPSRGWDRYAVLCRTNSDIDRIADALRLEGVPFDREVDKSILEDQGVEDALAWVGWLVDPRNTASARRVLVRPPYTIAGERVIQLDMNWRAAVSHAQVGKPGAADPGLFHEWLGREHAGDGAVGAALRRYTDLRAQVGTMRGDRALQTIITSLDLAHGELLPSRRRARRILALVALLRLARDVQSRLEQPGDLHALAGYLEELRELKEFGPRQGLGDFDDEELEGEGEKETGRVQLITAHRAKGLEFDAVFVPRVGPPHGYGKVRSEEGWEPPAGLFDRMDDRDPKSRQRDEERRLFYVACTRAERRLVILSRWNRNPSGTTHFFEELVRTNPTPLPIVQVTHSDVLEQAARSGHAAGGRSALSESAAREAIEELAERAKTRARQEAAGALEEIARTGVSGGDLAKAQESVSRAAERLAAISHAARTGEIPAWHVPASGDVVALAKRVKGEAGGATASSRLIRPMKGPLALSYSMLNDYQRCARCFYLKHELGLGEESTEAVNLGTIAHRVLELFFDRVRRAEGEGAAVPGLDGLHRLANEEYARRLGPGEAADRAMLEQLRAQVELCLTRLHDPAANILEVERRFKFPYEVDGQSHTMTGTLDRVEQLASGEYRVVDYKTGKSRKKLTEPEPIDLQFGIYAVALRHLYGADLRGRCEYWVLSTGERGVIDLADLKVAEVRGIIDDAVRGMLKGEFPRNDRCTGDCGLIPD